MDASRVREDVSQAGHQIQENLTAGVEKVQHQIEEQVRRGVDRTRGAVSSLNRQLEGFVQEAPVLAIGGAFVVGYLLAKLARAAR
jgi:ElaB/YqjD/DUF883 family membrane-anchored ribosome-binding protein